MKANGYRWQCVVCDSRIVNDIGTRKILNGTESAPIHCGRIMIYRGVNVTE